VIARRTGILRRDVYVFEEWTISRWPEDPGAAAEGGAVR
jgi:hypothetical protein